MLNTIHGLVCALNSFGINTDSWSSIIIFHLSQLFDISTLEHWEEKLEGKKNVPELKTLLDFLETRIVTCETTETFSNTQSIERNSKANGKQQTNYKPSFENKKPFDRVKAFYTLKSEYKCVLCEKNHLPSRCDELIKMSASDRLTLVKRNNLCENCFYPHHVKSCPFEAACKKCTEPHNSLLHLDSRRMFLNQTESTETATASTNSDTPPDDNEDALSQLSKQYFYHVSEQHDDDSLLATALVPSRFSNRSVIFKALIDPGSTANLISINACRLLNLKFTRCKLPMLGVGNTPVGEALGKVSFEVGSMQNQDFKLIIRAIVVRSVGDINGFGKKIAKEWTHLQNLPLADPSYFESGKIDLLLGSATHADIILSNVIKGKREHPIAQLTEFGYIISGRIRISSKTVAMCHHVNAKQFENSYADMDLNRQLKAFWELEEITNEKMLTPEEKMAEEVFQKSVRRESDGKFIVDLPFKHDPFTNLGESRILAERRYKSLQRRFIKNPELKTKYDAVLEEYLSLGHMTKVNDSPSHQYFLPHHAVLKESSTTTKVRTVFDGSAKTSTGSSLNDCLCVGPVIQPELFDLLTNWRKFEFALSADIEKMYRMIYVNSNHANFQTILWHRPGTSGIEEYKLQTVSFGTSSAAYQATRAVYEVGEQIKSSDASLSSIIQNSFYVDDFFKSFSEIEAAQMVRKSISEKLGEYGFKLRKWKTNDERVLKDVDDTDKEECIDFDSMVKTLGISWQSKLDVFVFKSVPIETVEVWTKRKVLSAIAKLFDPLGWLSPCIVKAKILMQDIWRLSSEITWDSELPKHINDQWISIFNEITVPVPIKIPRWLKLSNSQKSIEIHTFCDASNIAYAGCVYLRIVHNDDSVSCNLIAAKTKVAPVRATTIPRLELCGALLASKLTIRCIHSLSLSEFKVFAWCDSKIVATHPSKWVTFVANRVSEIQQNVNNNSWLHVPSKSNPADIASRGHSISELNNSSMWWHGPTYLTSSHEANPKQDYNLPIDTAPEKRKIAKLHHIQEIKTNHVLERFSDYTRLLRFTCYATRWLNKYKHKTPIIETISALEIDAAEKRWIKIVQREHFGHEIGRLSKKQGLPNNSQLIKLTPFMDADGFLRMNGRVGNAELMQQKLSIILPSNSHFIRLIIQHVHQTQVLHGGVQLTLRALRERFWIVHARNQVKKFIGRCMVCYRTKKKLLTQQMAELPSFRTEQARPFTFVGTDYAGYFEIKTSDRRNAPFAKGYVVLFICLTTKAVHLELACDLSTAEFIMALENFTARRGMPNVLWADNATNYTGAEKEIRTLHDQMLAQTNELTRLLSNNRITFKHTPARASHMAGIWERAVGLVKYHLKRVMKNTKLTSRRFDHVLKQIECCLNSRPLWAISPNADDFEVITPSHFFNFKPINSLPRPDLSQIPMNRLDQYQYLYRLYTEFWKGWAKEYLDQLQPRPKWNKEEPNVRIGQIVVVSDDNLPPSRWPIGRITAVYPAKDGLIRTVDVLCHGSTLKRPIHRLGMLPILDNSTGLSRSVADLPQ